MLQILEAGLRVSLGQYSSAGRKAENQDFYGAVVPQGTTLAMKGIACAIADGISSSPVGHVAAETAVKSFLTDYYCTSDAWTVKTAASRVIGATNSWLYTQSRHVEERDLAHVTTFSALVFKGSTTHLFHIGDSRISRIVGADIEPLTADHRLRSARTDSHLVRALRLMPSVEIDYRQLGTQSGEVFVLTTDGVHDHVPPRDMIRLIKAAASLDAAAEAIALQALEAGSTDNLTVQIVRVDGVGEHPGDLAADGSEPLPPAPLPQVPGQFEGFHIRRQIHASSRSHVFLASADGSDRPVALKFPSVDMRDDQAYLRRFAMEEWVMRRVSSAHVLSARPTPAPRRSLYLVTEYVDGQSLSQWMRDRQRLELATCRDVVGQIAAGLQALHRKEILHQDLRPDNILIDGSGTVKLIDFGSARVAGVVEAVLETMAPDILGTFQYTAPEYFLGERGSERSDLFSLGVITYQLLTGRLPYGAAVARTNSPRQQARLRFRSMGDLRPDVPGWVEAAIRRAVHPDPAHRYDAISEFVHDLSHPRSEYDGRRQMPLAERNPLLFWQALSLFLSIVILLLLWQMSKL
ncbi:serine/threonine protein phosphatase PrpC [Pseudorhizobium tarimense]|uniref:Serine/threonine protein phosphatase PrpC n=1 Tax=Pseudorhizobium tarimense TaxID=1079109 RepID=A0ABV2HDX4_9HYPH|nr:bifunctional protein-serine/threonine kinase/phosphatase [Pseudorhizobium tarimense]MCJ8521713.1 bifunctional serine/threonine-protein phosphatase/kinase [Pseudorhizobium tarimense]